MFRENVVGAAILVLRVTLGAIFVAHGAQKVFGAFGGSGIEPFAEMVGNLGFTPPLVWAWIAALSEFVGGIFLILGILPRLSAFAIACTMGVAIYKVHNTAFFASQGGFEYPLMLLAACVSIIIAGSGKFSVLDVL